MKKVITIAAGLLIMAVAAPTLQAADMPAGYKKKCAPCHGMDGKAKTKMGKKLKCRDLTDPAVQARVSDEAIVKSIKEGVTEDGKVRMKPVTGLSDAEIAEIVKFVRTLKK